MVNITRNVAYATCGHWLKLLEKSGYVTNDQIKDMKSECVSIIKMLTASINTMKNKNE